VVFGALDPPSCESMAPMPYADMSVRRMNGLVKSGCHSTGLLTILFCNVSNAICSFLVHDQGVVRCVNWSSGQAIFE
jgi:hypothetical protein